LLKEDTKRELVFRESGGRIVCVSGDPEAKEQGEHGHIVIADERQDLSKDVISESFVPMVGSRSGCIWLTGVGGDPECAGEYFSTLAEFRSIYPYDEHLKHFPEYKRTVDIAKRTMLPEEFDSHYKCLPLTHESNALIPFLVPYDVLPDQIDKIHVGIDWGKRMDRSVVTVNNITPSGLFVSEWLLPEGSYPEQVDQIADYLNNYVEYDKAFSEYNGVGDGPTDYLLQKCKAVVPVSTSSTTMIRPTAWSTGSSQERNTPYLPK